MTEVTFDIETIPNTSMIARLPKPDVKAGNLKDPAKIAEKEAAARAEQIEKMALSPLWGRVCAWVGAEDAETVHAECLTAETDAEEARIVEEAFRTLSKGRIVTYNGKAFDLPFIYRRAVLLGIDPREFGMPTLADLTSKYSSENRHIDIMVGWCGFGQFEKLDNIAAAMLEDHKITIDFHDFPKMIETQKGRKTLLDYCKQDVLLTQRIYNRIAGILI